jgi:hypothetical protein
VALNREGWRIILRKARAHKGLSCQWWWWWIPLLLLFYHFMHKINVCHDSPSVCSIHQTVFSAESG